MTTETGNLFEWRAYEKKFAVLTGSGAALIQCATWLSNLVRNVCYTILYMVTCPLVVGNMTQR